MKSGTVFLTNPRLSYYSKLPVASSMYFGVPDDCLVVYVCAKEKIDIDIDNTVYFMDEKNVAVVEAGVNHTVLTPITQEHQVYKMGILDLHLTGYGQGKIAGDSEHPIVDMSDSFDNFFAICDQLFYEHENKTKDGLSTYLLSALILMMVRIVRDEEVKAISNITEGAKAYIDEHLDEDINLTKLSSHIFVSSFHLIHTFKKDMGITPIQYLILKRMNKAKQLLTTTDKTVSEISLKVGYDNPNYFNMLFKKTVGISPGKYRKSKSRF